MQQWQHLIFKSMMDWQRPQEGSKTKFKSHEQLIDLVGQAAVINDAKLRIRSGAKLIQLVGLPLVGKSSIAYKVGDELSRQAIEWFGCKLHVHTVSLRGNISSIQNIRQIILHSLDCVDPKIASNHSYFMRYFKCYPGMICLIFDNVEIVNEDKNIQDEFLDLCIYMCHASKRLCLILTTRLQYSFVRELSTFHTIEVRPLTKEDSRTLFRSITGDLGLWEQQLLSLCAGIPYAIIMVARTLRINFYTPAEMLSILKSTGLHAFSVCALDKTNLQTELVTCIQKLDMYLKKSFVNLAYIPGTFSAEAAAYISGISVAATKHDVIEPLHSMSLVLRGDSQCDRFQIHAFVRTLIEDHYGLLKDESLIRNRYCQFFAQLLQRLAPLADRSRERNFHLITQELTNLEKLLQQAVHMVDEHYELFYDIAYNAEYHIINLMPKKESVNFYEALMMTAKVKDPRQYGILLSSFGQVLNFAQTRYSKAYDQYMKSLEYLRPMGDSHDLAWLYSHVGYFWYELGHFMKAERYGRIAYNMIKRVKKQVSKEVCWYKERDIQVPQGLFQKDFMTDKITGHIISTLGLVCNELGRTHEAAQYHHECLNLRWVIYGFHPTLGSCYNNLCETYEKMGDFPKALKHARIGMNIKTHFIKDPSNAVIESLVHTARLTVRTGGDTCYAFKLLREAYEQRRVLGLPHTQALCILYEIGRIRYQRMEYQKAVETLQGAVVMHGQMESPRRQKGETLRMLGLALRGTGQLQKAAEILAKSVEEQKAIPEKERTEDDTVKFVTTEKELTGVEKLVVESK